MTHGEIVSFLRSVADLLRDGSKRGKYQGISSNPRRPPPGAWLGPQGGLPLTVLDRLARVLAPIKQFAGHRHYVRDWLFERLQERARLCWT